jgi:hypothetical protein
MNFLFAILSFVLLVHAQGRSTMSEVRALAFTASRIWNA